MNHAEIKTKLLDLVKQGDNVLVFDPEREYEGLCRALGGSTFEINENMCALGTDDIDEADVILIGNKFFYPAD